MKKLALLIFLLSYVLLLSAQEEFLDKTKSFVLSHFKTEEVADSGKSDDNKMTFVILKITEGHYSAVYFNKENICEFSVAMFDNNNDFFDVVEKLNKKYDKILPYSWINKEATIKVTLSRNEKGFTVSYKKL